jgi:hypothetical protein
VGTLARLRLGRLTRADAEQPPQETSERLLRSIV